MATVLTVPCEIMWESGIVEANPKDGPYAVVRIKCLASDRYQLVQELLGTASRSGSSVTRTYPFAYAPSPNLICRAIENIEFLGEPYPLISGTHWIAKKWAILTARFEPALFFPDGAGDPSGKPYTATTLNISSEFLTLPSSTYKFPSGAPTNTPVGRQIPQIQINEKRFMLPFLPIAEMGAIVGMVNAGVFSCGGLACPSGTVLFVGGTTEIQSDTMGNRLYSAEYNFVYKPIPWNQFLSPNPTEGFAVVTDGNGDPVYESGDFSILP
ncbi:hypothetical protein ACYOEI_20580 [Singulisphaera rosea]